MLHTNSFSVKRLKSTRTYLCYLSFAVFLGFSVNGLAQEELNRHSKTTSIQLKANQNKSSDETQVITESISEKNAQWLRLFFEDVELGENSTISITSEEDGATQTFNAQTFKEWGLSTAYFNGDKLKITLTKAAGDKNISATIKELSIGDQVESDKSICGPEDNRVASNDRAVGRLAPTGCTGWIIKNGRLVTAGHCYGRLQVIMFNVPKSRPNRRIVFPGPEHQYPITRVVVDRDAPGETDWAVLYAGRNSQTGKTPIEGQGKSYNVVRSAPKGPMRVTGYGSDTGSDNATQQTHSGRLVGFSNSNVRYNLDTRGGNSGSPIIDDATGNAVGVHAWGSCKTNGSGANGGTRATVAAFWRAMGLDNVNPPPPPPNPGNVVTWTSANYDRYVIRHTTRKRGLISRIVRNPNDAKWKMVPGLAGRGVSFQSVNRPNQYLRHRNSQVRLDPFQNTPLYRQDATFIIVDGLADKSKKSFRSFNYPNRYIRHRNFFLYVEEVNSAMARRDATFFDASRQGNRESFGENGDFSIHPNPVENWLYINESLDQNEEGIYYIYNLLGKKVYEGTVSNGGTIDVFSFPKGMYMIKSVTSGKTQRFIKN